MSQLKQYLRKPVLVAAIQWTGDNLGDIVYVSRDRPELLYIDKNVPNPPLAIILGKKESLAMVGDYIVFRTGKNLKVVRRKEFEDSYYVITEEDFA